MIQTYTITEVLDKFQLKDDIAFANSGEMEGTLIFVDIEKNNRLSTVYADGSIKEHLYISLKEDGEKENARHWVFAKEVFANQEENKELIDWIISALSLHSKRLYKNMSDEEQKEIKKSIRKKYGIQ